ncbi:MAG: sulfur carrier protein ThiS [Desulforegulaceae bacterium]|nr:sulfur carrier protein ThiS [Desulforegulaceae bacterium]
MVVILNGQKEKIPRGTALGEFLKSKGANFDEIVVELNESVIETKNYNQTILKENDRLEVLRFVGGG